jgi:glucuronate isomerase
MKAFIDPNFLLHSDVAIKLYNSHASTMPIIDYHCHLDPRMIADNKPFADMTDIWLGGDHYKWRAMRANGISEDYITGNRPSWEKFAKWAETVPYTMRNPLYHWTHLELSRIFGINKTLNPSTAREIYEEGTAKLRNDEFRPRRIMERMQVEVVCTTDDPIDSLEYHEAIRKSGFRVKVLPTWRPDRVMAIDNVEAYNAYLDKLENISELGISSYDLLIEALWKRHDFFAQHGCRISDHGLETFYAEPYTDSEIRAIFRKLRSGQPAEPVEALKFRSAILYESAKMDAMTGWAQQFHIGAIRNNNSRMFAQLGPDTGYDSIHDVSYAAPMNRFLARLDNEGMLARTILYNLNPKDSEMMVTAAYNFNDGSGPGKMQYGAGWWFLDQLKGMENQINALSSLGLLSRFVGMLTDSRSILSYPRHEYFRRLLCNILGNDIVNGEIPFDELPFVEQMVEMICYGNAKRYFGF